MSDWVHRPTPVAGTTSSRSRSRAMAPTCHSTVRGARPAAPCDRGAVPATDSPAEGNPMRAIVYQGPYRVRVEEKPDPVIEHPSDAVARVQLGAICGSGLHLSRGMLAATPV